jgi:hypothetical protein
MPSVSVSLSDDEYHEVFNAAQREGKSTGTYIAEIVRVSLRQEAEGAARADRQLKGRKPA